MGLVKERVTGWAKECWTLVVFVGIKMASELETEACQQVPAHRTFFELQPAPRLRGVIAGMCVCAYTSPDYQPSLLISTCPSYLARILCPHTNSNSPFVGPLHLVSTNRLSERQIALLRHHPTLTIAITAATTGFPLFL